MTFERFAAHMQVELSTSSFAGLANREDRSQYERRGDRCSDRQKHHVGLLLGRSVLAAAIASASSLSVWSANQRSKSWCLSCTVDGSLSFFPNRAMVTIGSSPPPISTAAWQGRKPVAPAKASLVHRAPWGAPFKNKEGPARCRARICQLLLLGWLLIA